LILGGYNKGKNGLVCDDQVWFGYKDSSDGK